MRLLKSLVVLMVVVLILAFLSGAAGRVLAWAFQGGWRLAGGAL